MSPNLLQKKFMRASPFFHISLFYFFFHIYIRTMNENKNLEMLMKKFLGGEKIAMAKIFQTIKAPLFSYLYRMCGNIELSEDILQETFILIFSKAKTYNIDKKFLPWAFTIARNKLLEWKRREGKIIRLPMKTPQSQETCPVQESKTETDSILAIKTILDGLSETIKEAFVMKHFEGMKFHEIAELQGIPVPTAKSRVLFAAKKLKDALGEAQS